MKPAAPVTRIGRAPPPSVYEPTDAGGGTDPFTTFSLSPPSRLRGLVGRRGAELRHLARQALDFLLQQVVLVELSPEEGGGDVDLLLDSLRREDVEVTCLVIAVAEVAGLDPALLHQRAEAIIDFADADAELAGELALRGIGVVAQILQQPVTDFVR